MDDRIGIGQLIAEPPVPSVSWQMRVPRVSVAVVQALVDERGSEVLQAV